MIVQTLILKFITLKRLQDVSRPLQVRLKRASVKSWRICGCFLKQAFLVLPLQMTWRGETRSTSFDLGSFLGTRSHMIHLQYTEGVSGRARLLLDVMVFHRLLSTWRWPVRFLSESDISWQQVLQWPMLQVSTPSRSLGVVLYLTLQRALHRAVYSHFSGTWRTLSLVVKWFYNYQNKLQSFQF